MKKLFVLAIVLISGSVSLHALTPSCDIFQRNFEGWQKSNASQYAGDALLQQYLRSSQAVLEAWCGAQPASTSVRTQAVEEFVDAYRVQRFNDAPNPQVRLSMGLQMLALLGLTHELPEPMQNDRKLREAWIQDCQDSCFARTADTPDSTWQITWSMQVRNDLINNLRPAPGVESIKRMLWEAPTAVLN